MNEFILVIHTLSAIGLIGLVLVQQGKGADVGAAFGSGGSQTLFGARGSANFLTRMTAGLAVVFFLTSLTLVYFSTRHTAPTSVTMPQPGQTPGPSPGESPGQNQKAPSPETPTVPTVPSSGPAAPPPVPK